MYGAMFSSDRIGSKLYMLRKKLMNSFTKCGSIFDRGIVTEKSDATCKENPFNGKDPGESEVGPLPN